jgi:hypothetical protein
MFDSHNSSNPLTVNQSLGRLSIVFLIELIGTGATMLLVSSVRVCSLQHPKPGGNMTAFTEHSYLEA